MGWSSYTATFGAVRPAFLPKIEDPAGCAEAVRVALEWMRPEVHLTAETSEVTLTMPAPGAEAAMHHLRGSLKSAFYTAGIPEAGNWQLTSVSVRPADEAADGAGSAHPQLTAV